MSGMVGFKSICTADGTIVARDPSTSLTASGGNLADAYAELRRLSVRKRNATVPAVGSSEIMESAA